MYIDKCERVFVIQSLKYTNTPINLKVFIHTYYLETFKLKQFILPNYQFNFEQNIFSNSFKFNYIYIF